MGRHRERLDRDYSPTAVECSLLYALHEYFFGTNSLHSMFKIMLCIQCLTLCLEQNVTCLQVFADLVFLDVVSGENSKLNPWSRIVTWCFWCNDHPYFVKRLLLWMLFLHPKAFFCREVGQWVHFTKTNLSQPKMIKFHPDLQLEHESCVAGGERVTWKSSTDGVLRWAVRLRCHWWSVFRVSELSTRAACSSWKFLMRDMAPYALVK